MTAFFVSGGPVARVCGGAVKLGGRQAGARRAGRVEAIPGDSLVTICGARKKVE